MMKCQMLFRPMRSALLRLWLPAVALLACPTMAVAQVATVRESVVEYECTGANTGVMRCRSVIEIHNQHGEHMGRWSVQCSDRTRELRKFEGLVVDAHGVTTKVKKGDLSYSEYTEALSSNDHYYYYAPRTKAYPITVTYQWEMTCSSHIVYPVFAPIEDFDVAVDSAMLRIITTPANTLRSHAVGFEPQLREYDVKAGHVTEVSLSGLKPIKRYGDGLPFEELIPIVWFAPREFDFWGSHCDMTDWRTYGQWSYDLQQGRDQLPDELLQRLHALTDTCTTPRSKVAAVRRLMGETTRYVNIALGIGGYQTRSAEEVYRTGFGDCKALTNYFCSMLHAIGLPANYTLIGKRHLLPDLPSMQQLNHVIAQVPLPDDTLWVECTNARYPFDYCPSGHRGHDVVIVTAQGGQLSSIPQRVDAENTRTSTYTVLLDSLGDASVHISQQGTGEHFEYGLYLQDMRSDELRKHVTSVFRLPHAMVGDLRVWCEGATSRLELDAQSQGWARRSESRLFVPVTTRPYANMATAKAQPHVIDLEATGGIETDSVCIPLPAGYEVESMPSTQVVEAPMGQFRLSVRQSADSASQQPCLTVVTQLHLHSGRYAADLYPDWVKFRQQIAALTKKQITLRRQ